MSFEYQVPLRLKIPTVNKCGFSLLVYTIESWIGVSKLQRLLDLTEVIKETFRVLIEGL